MAFPQLKYLPKKFPPLLRRRDWLKMEIDNDYILSWAFKAPNDLQMAILGGQLDGDELIQANAIIECLQNIRPPRRNPDHWRFLIRIGDNRSFIDFRIVRFGVEATLTGEYCSDCLSLFPRDWYREGHDYLVHKFHSEFFGHTPSLREMENFILNPKSCNLDYESALFSSNFRGPQINY